MAYIRNLEPDTRQLPPMCRHLRSKSMFVIGQFDVTAEHEQEASGNCWCDQTQHVFGPDQQVVGRYECDSTRTCYELRG